MTEAVFFVVVRRAGLERPAIIFDRLPDALSGKQARINGLAYALRIDKLPDAERWLAMPLAELFATYKRLEAQGCLPPPNLAEPSRKAEAAKILAGHRERIGLSGERPSAEPWPDPEQIKLRPGAGSYIGARHAREAGVD